MEAQRGQYTREHGVVWCGLVWFVLVWQEYVGADGQGPH